MGYQKTILKNGYISIQDFLKNLVKTKDPNKYVYLGEYVFYYQKAGRMYSLYYHKESMSASVCIYTTTESIY
jgi:hypothetical protein